jgi:hypothetical protein
LRRIQWEVDRDGPTAVVLERLGDQLTRDGLDPRSETQDVLRGSFPHTGPGDGLQRRPILSMCRTRRSTRLPQG